MLLGCHTLSMFKIVKKNRAILTIICALLLIATVYSHIVSYVSSGYNGITIVLDAGHGLPDERSNRKKWYK